MPAPLVLTLEEVAQRGTAGLLRRLGRPVRALAFPGFGTAEWARVRGRVLVAAAPTPPSPASSTAWSALRANLAQFLTVEVPYARVRVEVGGHSRVVVADREGYVDAVLDGLALAPGRHTATLTPVEPAGEPGSGTVHVPDPDVDLAVVSDVDDTIVDSGIAHGLLATITTALLRPQADRVALEGAPELYQALARGAGGPARPFLYLSTSPWNLVGFLQGFLERHRFPDGPLLLTDWGPGATGLFRIETRAHKQAALRELAAVLPRVRFVLVGDSGQQDPEIYTSFAVEHPGRVAAVYVRRAGDGGATAQQRLEQCARTLEEAAVPFVLADDSAAMLRHAQQLGLTRP